MKRLPAFIAAIALIVGLAIGSIYNNRADAQQAAAAAATARYQIAAFAGGTGVGGSVFHGCYQQDITTGEVWLIVPGQPTTKISNGPQR